MHSDSLSENTTKFDLFYEEVNFELENSERVIHWILDAFDQEEKIVAHINYIFCSDHYLHQLNIQYLNHDTLTDVITFPNSHAGAPIEGDIFISIDRITENAKSFGVSFELELLRVMIHGSLHLMGYKDKTPEDQQLMREKEDFYLGRYD